MARCAGTVRCGRPLDFEEYEPFRRFVSPPEPAPTDAQRANRQEQHELKLREATMTPMTPFHAAGVAVAYVGLAVLLLVLLRITRDFPGHANPTKLLE